MALFTFAASQALLFLASSKIAKSTHGRINGSMFSTLLDMLSVVLVYKFWHKITDGTINSFNMLQLRSSWGGGGM